VLHKSANPFRKILPPSVVSKVDPETGKHNPFPTYPFTGALRPVYPLSPKREVPSSIPHPDYAADGIPKLGSRFVGRNNITILDKAGQDGMRKVCRLAREVLDIAAREVRPGITTDYLDEVVHMACLERNVRYQGGRPATSG
jgi:methionyl aminopeptidase